MPVQNEYVHNTGWHEFASGVFVKNYQLYVAIQPTVRIFKFVYKLGPCTLEGDGTKCTQSIFAPRLFMRICQAMHIIQKRYSGGFDFLCSFRSLQFMKFVPYLIPSNWQRQINLDYIYRCDTAVKRCLSEVCAAKEYSLYKYKYANKTLIRTCRRSRRVRAQYSPCGN
jgi:hypothetical protein